MRRARRPELHRGRRAAAVLLLAGGVWPAAALADSGWTAAAKVLELTVETPVRVELRLDVEANPSRCSQPQHFFRAAHDAASARMFDLLHAALRDGRAVRVYVTGVCDINGAAEFSRVGTVR